MINFILVAAFVIFHGVKGFPGGSGKQRICLQCRKPGFDAWVGKMSWRRAWQPTPVFLPREPPRIEEPGGLQSMESERVGHD